MKRFDDYQGVSVTGEPEDLPPNAVRWKLIKLSEIVKDLMDKTDVDPSLLYHDHTTRPFVQWLVEVSQPEK